MTRTPRHPVTGKPLPAPAPPPDWQDEPTVRIPKPTNEELEAELLQHATEGQGYDATFHRRVL